jgi:small subunit ribosomal protein S9
MAAKTATQSSTHTVGRRKEAVCRVYLKPGSGKWDVNGRTLGDYFPRPSHVTAIQQPFTATDTLGRYDVQANLAGGGQSGQAGALRLAVARALVKEDESYRGKLRNLGFLTRDARAVERKKPGRPNARKKFQFSKR